MGRFIAAFLYLFLHNTPTQASDTDLSKSPITYPSPLAHEIQTNKQAIEAAIKTFETSYRECASDADVQSRNDRLIELVKDMKNRVRRWQSPEDRAVGYYAIVNYDLSLENLALAYYYGLQYLKPEYVNSLQQDFLEAVPKPSIYQVPRTFPDDLPATVHELLQNQSKLTVSQPGQLHPIEYAAFWHEQPLLYTGPGLCQAGQLIVDNLPVILCFIMIKTLAYYTSVE